MSPTPYIHFFYLYPLQYICIQIADLDIVDENDEDEGFVFCFGIEKHFQQFDSFKIKIKKHIVL